MRRVRVWGVFYARKLAADAAYGSRGEQGRKQPCPIYEKRGGKL